MRLNEMDLGVEERDSGGRESACIELLSFLSSVSMLIMDEDNALSPTDIKPGATGNGKSSGVSIEWPLGCS